MIELVYFWSQHSIHACEAAALHKPPSVTVPAPRTFETSQINKVKVVASSCFCDCHLVPYVQQTWLMLLSGKESRANPSSRSGSCECSSLLFFHEGLKLWRTLWIHDVWNREKWRNKSESYSRLSTDVQKHKQQKWEQSEEMTRRNLLWDVWSTPVTSTENLTKWKETPRNICSPENMVTPGNF